MSYKKVVQLTSQTIPTIGTVVSIEASYAQVSTVYGTVTVSSGLMTTLRVGDVVKLSGNVITGKLTNADTLPVYYV